MYWFIGIRALEVKEVQVVLPLLDQWRLKPCSVRENTIKRTTAHTVLLDKVLI